MTTASMPSAMLPHSIEAEQAVLGAVLADADCFTKVIELVDGSDFFYKKAHQHIFEAFLKLSERSQNIDTVTVAQYLSDHHLLDDAGGRSYLSELSDHAPIAANAEYYSRIVKDKSLLRHMIVAGNEIVQLGYQSEQDLDKLVDQAEQLVFDLAQGKAKESLTPISNLIHKSWEILEEREANKGALSGVDTGFYDLNTMTAGLQKSDMIILAARPSMGKCLHKDTELVLADGSIATMEELYQRKDAELFTLSDDWKFSTAKPSAYIDDGIKPIFEVLTRSGRKIKTTITHPYLTIDGWKKLGTIGVGDHIAVPRLIKTKANKRIRDCEAKLLGYLIGDGCLTKSTLTFSNSNPAIQEDFIQAVKDFDPSLELKVFKSNHGRVDNVIASKSHEFVVAQRAIFAGELKRVVNASSITQAALAETLGVSAGTVTYWMQAKAVPANNILAKLSEKLGFDFSFCAFAQHKSRSSVIEWLEELGLYGKNAHQKTVPAIVFQLSNQQIALFLNRLFATDGWATLLSSGQSQLGYASVSEKLVRAIQHLLLRFGILSDLAIKRVKYKGDYRNSWQLTVTNPESITKFISDIGIFSKEAAIARVRESQASKRYATNKDLIPKGIWKYIAELKGDESWASLARRAGLASTSNIHPFVRAPQRTRLAKLARALGAKELEKIAESDVYWDEIVSINYVGDDQVYDLTVEGTHNFVAADICVHNTALALNVAENVAIRTKRPVAVFSLEMSRDQLVQRMLCCRAEVDSQRVRSGQLLAEDWERLGKAMSELGEAPIFIDDSAGVTIMEIRGKCRRLQAQQGDLGLVVIDYLQLIEGRNNETRINQISEISRGLKLLARELNAPVLALSQLSRAVESRQDKRPMLSDLRESGCLPAETLIFRPDIGNYVPIIELVGQTDFTVLALDENKKLVEAKASKAFYSGKKNVYELTTCSGHKIKASANHPFLTVDGWKQLGGLEIGGHIATARKLTSRVDVKGAQNPEASIEEMNLLAHMIGDGCFAPNQPYHYTSKDQQCLRLVSDLAKSLYSIDTRIVEDRNSHECYALYLPSPYRLTHGVHHPFTNLLTKLGLHKCRGYKKELPAYLMSCDLSTLASFIRHLYATDGTVCFSGTEAKGRYAVAYSSQSEILIRQLKTLLLRFGVSSRISVGKKGNYRNQYQLVISDADNIKLFAEQIGFFGKKVFDFLDIKDGLNGVNSNPNADVIPSSVWTKVRQQLQEKGMSHREFQSRLGTKYCGSTLFKSNLSRKRLAKVAGILESQDLTNLAESDIYWDKIKSIELVDEVDVYDITVPQHHNFVAANFILHNSIEQDADIVMFIYRDDYYNPESEKAGIAEVIIGKQRNGPVGTVDLLFQSNITKFKNPA